MTKEYAYIRVSSQEQNEERQMIAMRELHVPEEIIFMDNRGRILTDRGTEPCFLS
jgi:DNA invertase Pin-like site-specific DNA recombinase